jgi:hypothetical protein
MFVNNFLLDSIGDNLGWVGCGMGIGFSNLLLGFGVFYDEPMKKCFYCVQLLLHPGLPKVRDENFTVL